MDLFELEMQESCGGKLGEVVVVNAWLLITGAARLFSAIPVSES